MHDLIVIGGGPAGLTAAIYAIRKRLNVLLVSKDLGGKTNYHLALPWIEDYQVIRGLEVVNKFRSELEYLDFARRMEPVERVCVLGDSFAVSTRNGDELFAKAVIVATGARQRRLDVPGEKDYTMRGLCYSALSYAPLFIDRTAAVIGDGELALRSAAELATIARRVYLVCCAQTGGSDLLYSPLGKKLVAAENVTLLEGYQVVRIQGDQFARSMVLNDPTGELIEIHTDGIFIEKGLTPHSDMVANLVNIDAEGRIKVDYANRTNVPGIYAAGDVTTTYAEQVLVAVGEGAKAALSAYDFLLPTL
ncbi:MAG TPA: FAD-dependent oxidoreductase [Anaerolineales bacterium]